MGLTCDPSLQDEELYQLFSGIANLGSRTEAVRFARDPHINLGKGIAYVLFKTRVCALCKISDKLQQCLFAYFKLIRGIGDVFASYLFHCETTVWCL